MSDHESLAILSQTVSDRESYCDTLHLCVSCSSFCREGGVFPTMVFRGKGDQIEWVCSNGTMYPAGTWMDMDDVELDRLIKEAEMEAGEETKELQERLCRVMRCEVVEPPAPAFVPCPCVNDTRSWRMCCGASREPRGKPLRHDIEFENRYDPRDPDFYDPEPPCPRARSRTPPRTPPRRLNKNGL